MEEGETIWSIGKIEHVKLIFRVGSSDKERSIKSGHKFSNASLFQLYIFTSMVLCREHNSVIRFVENLICPVLISNKQIVLCLINITLELFNKLHSSSHLGWQVSWKVCNGLCFQRGNQMGEMSHAQLKRRETGGDVNGVHQVEMNTW